ncbi:MAG: septum formation protein Maf [Gammaproteobacteria bacterium]|nr:septum formation protein Maf [Gammaproteobacteria bacterium]
MSARRLVLASGSPWRRALLERLRLPFDWQAPETDEAVRVGETPRARAERLARTKAMAVRERFPTAWLIGSDQVAVCDGKLLGKPGSPEGAQRQLETASGRCVHFLTAVCLTDAASGTTQAHVDETTVHMRALAPEQIERYVRLDQPCDCAGGFRAEALGIALFERIESSDPTALIGLPLIWLSGALSRIGFDIP